MQCLIYGYAATYDLNDVPYAVLDQDRGPALLRLAGPAGRLGRVPPRGRSRTRGRHRDVHRRPAWPCWSSRFRKISNAGCRSGQAGESAGDRRRPQFQHRRHRHWATSARWSKRSTPIGCRAIANRKPARRFRSIRRAWFNPNLETRWNMIPSLIGTLTMMQTLLLTAMSVAREREQGTFDQLLVTPFRPVEIMAGKAMPSVLIGMVQATTVLAGRPALVPHSIRRLVLHAVRGARRVSAGGGGHRAVGLVAGGDDAAGDAVLVRADHAVFAAVGPHDADQQHADDSAVFHATSIRCATRSKSRSACIWKAQGSSS